MSTDLYWRPIAKGKALPIALKWILEKRWFGIGRGYGPICIDRKSIPYLDGLVDSKIEGAQELIELIEKYDEIEIYISE